MNECIFCHSPQKKIYKMGKYDIFQCVNCKTSSSDPMPTDQEIIDYYNGFYERLNSTTKTKRFCNKYFKKWFKGFQLPENAKMLDIGGGGGFLSHSFEHFNNGTAYYVDIDKKSCDFASEQLKLKNVHCQNVLDWNSDQKFDFIICRHVIEHLKDPLSLVDKAIELLAPNGTFVLMFPNGETLECLGYPSRIKKRIEIIKESNNMSSVELYYKFLTGKIAHGLDPLRHLYAISEKGIHAHLSSHEGIKVESLTAPLTHPVYSPLVRQRKGFWQKTRSRLVNRTLSRFKGGIHQVFLIQKT